MTSFNDALSDAAYNFLKSHYKDGVMGLAGCKLTSVPMELLKFKDMKELWLFNNELTSIPPEIGQLVNLKKLYLDNNQLTSIPPELGQLVNLQQLSLSYNKLISIPPEIGQLVNLQELYLTANQLTSIPSEIGQLVNLQQLWLSGNQLTSIPPEIGQLVNLKQLCLYDSKLTSIPIELGELTNLQIYGYDKPKPIIKKYSFKEELVSLIQKARQKEAEDYSWMTIHKEEFEKYMRQEATKGNSTAIYEFKETLTDEKLKNLDKILKQEYPDLTIHLKSSGVEVNLNI